MSTKIYSRKADYAENGNLITYLQELPHTSNSHDMPPIGYWLSSCCGGRVCNTEHKDRENILSHCTSGGIIVCADKVDVTPQEGVTVANINTKSGPLTISIRTKWPKKMYLSKGT